MVAGLNPCPPGSVIGIIGGGQLGRMLAIAGAQLGYKCHIFDPHEAPCAADVAARFTRAAFDDVPALQRFAQACDIVTYEFENLPTAPLEAIAAKLRPGTMSLRIAQDRVAEKEFIERCGASPAPWRAVDGPSDIVAALQAFGSPIVLKTRRMGYDGKGQTWVDSSDEAEAAWQATGKAPSVAEAKIDFEAEFSVILARGPDGSTAAFPVSRNTHFDGILRRTTVPAGPLIDGLAQEAVAIAGRMAEGLDHIGVLSVEFFACGDRPLVNEFAPRVHNSGHWTIEGAQTSQFEQHIRAICGLALGPTNLIEGGSTMDNLIGDEVENWGEFVSERGAHLHLYGKGEARPGRKMGHVTRIQGET